MIVKPIKTKIFKENEDLFDFIFCIVLFLTCFLRKACDYLTLTYTIQVKNQVKQFHTKHGETHTQFKSKTSQAISHKTRRVQNIISYKSHQKPKASQIMKMYYLKYWEKNLHQKKKRCTTHHHFSKKIKSNIIKHHHHPKNVWSQTRRKTNLNRNVENVIRQGRVSNGTRSPFSLSLSTGPVPFV